MFVIEIICALMVFGGLIYAVGWFNAHCSKRFRHKFFTSASFISVLASLLLIFGGKLWYASAAESHGATLNGIMLMVLGAAGLVAMVWYNIRRTNLAYGIGGSALQIPALAFLAYVSLPILVIAVIGYIYLVSRAQPVFVVNK